ncbi:hypothetical protein [Bordetella sp. FB-8]|uniref:hypothetical protein n=1 Tax=Bordetella sp. FB-8 TaxID=1159870 RepID=UPI00035CB7B7|nr:hypothetical protein [Bordetella sp. FB-8]
MDTPSPTSKSPAQHVATGPAAVPPPEPRSKLEYMFRAMLVEADQLTTRSESLVKQLNAAAMQMQTLPSILRKTSAAVQDQATTRAVQQMREVSREIDDSRRLLKRTAQALGAQQGRNLWTIGLVAFGCSLLGGLTAALIVLTAFK